MKRLGLGRAVALGLAAVTGSCALLPPKAPTPAPAPVAEAPTVKAGPPPELPQGYTAEPVATGIPDPKALVFTASAQAYVLEGSHARLSRIEPGGKVTPVARGGDNGPWTGAASLGDVIYIAEAGGSQPGRILAFKNGGVTPLPVQLPKGGVVGPLASGPDGWLYLGVASADSSSGGARDIPCQDLRYKEGGGVTGRVPCTGSVLRISPVGRDVEMFAWGFRRPTGLAFTPTGRLLVADALTATSQAAGQTPVNPLWAVAPGVWYGWPQAAGELASAAPELEAMPNPPPPPILRLQGEIASVAISERPEPAFGPAGEAYIASERGTGGGEVLFLNPAGRTIAPFAVNIGDPRALAFAPDGSSLWIADGSSGTIWRIKPSAGKGG